MHGLAVTMLVRNSGVDVKSEKISARRQEALENALLARSRDILYNADGSPYLNPALTLEQRLGILAGELRLLNRSDRARLLDALHGEINSERTVHERLLFRLMFVEALKKSGDDELWKNWKSSLIRDAGADINEAGGAISKGSGNLDLKTMAYLANYWMIMEPGSERNEIKRLLGNLSTRMDSLANAQAEDEIISRNVNTREGLAFLVLSLSLGELLDAGAIREFVVKAGLRDNRLVENVFANNYNPYVERALGRLSGATAAEADTWMDVVAIKGANLFALSRDAGRRNDELITFAILELCNGLPPLIDGKTLEEKIKRSGGISVKEFRSILISG